MLIGAYLCGCSTFDLLSNEFQIVLVKLLLFFPIAVLALPLDDPFLGI